MKLLIILILTACKSPVISYKERCAVSFTFDKCRCVQYDIMSAQAIGEGYDKPLRYCDDIVGFHAQDWAKEITPWAKKSIRYYNNTCKSK